MSVPKTVFDRPQAVLVPDRAGLRFYANISNRMEVTTDSVEQAVAVAVPTELFTFLKEVAKIPPEDAVTLAIDQVEPDDEDDKTYYVFSLLRGDDLYDLWHYSEGSLPPWVVNRKYAAR